MKEINGLGLRRLFCQAQPRRTLWQSVMALLLLVGCGLKPAIPPASTDLSAYPWIYLREGRSIAAGETLAETVLTGDIMLGRGAAGEVDPFGAAAPWLEAAGLAVGNFEGALLPGEAESGLPTEAPGGPYYLIAPFEAAGKLAAAGFDLAGLANNHALDRGLDGLEETAGLLAQAGITVFGAGPSRAAAYAPVVRTIGDARLAFLALNAIPVPRSPGWTGEVRPANTDSGWDLAGWDRDQALAAIREARRKADGVIVFIHWGYEYETRADPLQASMALDLAEAGADLIVGHHPHVVQEVETLEVPGSDREAFAAYSLGNFVFDQAFDGAQTGLVLRAFFDRQGLRGVQALPVRTGLKPALLDPQTEIRRRSSSATPAVRADFRLDPKSCRLDPDVGENLPASARALQVDLTGEQALETVSLEGERVSIRSLDGHLAWQSPPEWQVIDLASGDPNQDGRQELVIAVNKADPSGVMLSHPYVFGYRQGEYRLLWGGSAASDPIEALELGDIDADGRDELVVLDRPAQANGRRVSVWRWNGWGFTQVCRSEPGNFGQLWVIGGQAFIAQGERSYNRR